jgi:hypothetical protein
MIYAIEMASVASYIHKTFHEDLYRHSSNIKVLPQKAKRL